MTSPAEIEESPTWLAILRYLADAGATGTTPVQILQDKLAEILELKVRRLRFYIKRMEEHGVITVKRSTVGGVFGTPRAPNEYFLHCTAEKWERELGPKVMRAKRAQRERRAEHVGKVKQMEAARAAREKYRPGPAVDEATIGVLTAEVLDGIDSDEDLRGW